MMANEDMLPGRFAQWAAYRERLAWIVARCEEGLTVYFQTPLRVTTIKSKHLPLLKATQRGLWLKCGTKWVDYSHCAVGCH